MPLTRQVVQGWLVRQCRAHLVQAGYSLEIEDWNPDLNDAIWGGLMRHGIQVVDPSEVSDNDFLTILPRFYLRFLIGCKIALKRIILDYYRSKATLEGVMGSRIEFTERADGLASDLKNIDEPQYEEATATAFSGGSFGSSLSSATNVPDAICIPYVEETI